MPAITMEEVERQLRAREALESTRRGRTTSDSLEGDMANSLTALGYTRLGDFHKHTFKSSSMPVIEV